MRDNFLVTLTPLQYKIIAPAPAFVSPLLLYSFEVDSAMRVLSKVTAGISPSIVSMDEKSDKGVLGLVLITTQLFTALVPFLPLIKFTLQTVIRCLKGSCFSSIIFKMRTFKNRNCKLRYMAFSAADVIIDTIQQKPAGRVWWFSLSKKGRGNREVIRKKIADTLLHSFYDDNFISILLKGALDEKGKPRGDSALYQWLLNNVYSDNVQKLYNDWLRASRQQNCDV